MNNFRYTNEYPGEKRELLHDHRQYRTEILNPQHQSYFEESIKSITGVNRSNANIQYFN